MGDTPTGIALHLANFATVISSIITYVTGNVVLMTVFAGGLFMVGAKVFKKIKNSVK